MRKQRAAAAANKENKVPTNLSTLRPPKGATANRKRVGRGMGSGMGKTSTRGHKGQRSRSGSRSMRGFEGGQMPLQRRLPKIGFKNRSRIEYAVINLDKINSLKGIDVITPETLIEKRIIRDIKDGLKVLGDGKLERPVTVKATAFSVSATEKIAAAGGKAEVI